MFWGCFGAVLGGVLGVFWACSGGILGEYLQNTTRTAPEHPQNTLQNTPKTSPEHTPPTPKLASRGNLVIPEAILGLYQAILLGGNEAPVKLLNPPHGANWRVRTRDGPGKLHQRLQPGAIPGLRAPSEEKVFVCLP